MVSQNICHDWLADWICRWRSTIIQAMTDIASQATSNPTAVSQYAAVEALSGNQDSIEIMRQQFEDRLNKIYPIVAAIPGFQLVKPQGAFTFSQTSGKQ